MMAVEAIARQRDQKASLGQPLLYIIAGLISSSTTNSRIVALLRMFRMACQNGFGNSLTLANPQEDDTQITTLSF